MKFTYRKNHKFENDHISKEMIALCAEEFQKKDTDKIPKDVQNHVEECFECKEAIVDVSSMLTMAPDIRGIPTELLEKHETVPHRKNTWKTILYTSIIVLMFSALILQKRGAGTNDTVFSSDPMYEHYIGSQYRSDAGQLNIISPQVGMITNGEKVEFRWEYNNVERLQLTVLNNRQEIVVSTQSNDQRYMLTSTLPKGLYYWKLESATDLLYVGKFIVE